MSDFSLTTLFVATSGTLASAGSTGDLTGGQLGVYLQDYSIATTGNIAAAKYFYIAQGRLENTLYLGSKRSDKISPSRIIEWYKTSAQSVVPVEQWSLSNFHVSCGQDFNISIVAHSSYIDTVAYNGLTRTVTVKAPCCDCTAIPCADIQQTDMQNLVDNLVNKINAPAGAVDGAGNLLLSRFFTASRVGSGATSQLFITANPITIYGQPCDPSAFPFEYDRIWFRVFPYTGPATTQDFQAFDRCQIPAAALVTQRSLYPKGSSAEIKQLEKNFYSYQTSYSKHLHRMGGYNAGFQSYVTDGTFYDLYYIKFYAPDEINTINWNDTVANDSTVIVAFPQGTGVTSFEPLLTAALGAPVDKTGVVITTTTTTSTTSSSTTSTTTTSAPLIP